MGKHKTPVTPAVHVLRAAGVEFGNHPYRYVEHGGTAQCARELGVDEHAVVKTLIMEDDRQQPLVVLMHGDREVSTKALARAVGAKTVRPCAPAVASRHSGYQVGGTSPFGTRHSMPVYMQTTIFALPRIWINGGSRGYLVSMEPGEAARVLAAVLVNVAQPE